MVFKYVKTQCSEIDKKKTKKKTSAHTPFEVGAQAKPRVGAVNRIFLNHFGNSGLQETRITSDKLYGAIFFLHFKTSPQLL